MPIKPPTFQPPHARADARSFYGTQAWRKLAAFVKERDRYRCTEPACTTPGRGYGGRLIAGHVISRAEGGVDEPSNVRTFCPACDNRWHSEKGGWMGRGGD